jgi:hypothetical protein
LATHSFFVFFICKPPHYFFMPSFVREAKNFVCGKLQVAMTHLPSREVVHSPGAAADRAHRVDDAAEQSFPWR